MLYRVDILILSPDDFNGGYHAKIMHVTSSGHVIGAWVDAPDGGVYFLELC